MMMSELSPSSAWPIVVIRIAGRKAVVSNRAAFGEVRADEEERAPLAP
jgi:hypothetical protein